jgi:signal transduction histidine kinase
LRPLTVRRRLLLWSAGLTAAALFAAYFAVAATLEGFVAERYRAEMLATARAVMAAAAFDDAGVFTVDPPPADPRFAAPASGWAWQVSDGEAALARAPSLLSGDLGPDGLGENPTSAALDRVRLAFTAPGDGRALSVTVAMPSAERTAAAASAAKPLALALSALGVALLAAQTVAVRQGLLHLAALGRAVAALREGRIERLPEPREPDLSPIAREINRLIEAQAATVARSRAHVGNLAHALKGPLAVLLNDADPKQAALLRRMERSVRWHLGRARAAGGAIQLSTLVPIAEVAEDLRLVLTAEADHRGVTLAFSIPNGLAFAGEREDLTEMIGNLLENAVKWARTTARLEARLVARLLVVAVDDDGPGVPPTHRAALLARGARLDEGAPGHGLGLAIVADLAALYGGALTLEQSVSGGLRTTLTLPG